MLKSRENQTSLYEDKHIIIENYNKGSSIKMGLSQKLNPPIVLSETFLAAEESMCICFYLTMVVTVDDCIMHEEHKGKIALHH